jgi:hypothetical protein
VCGAGAEVVGEAAHGRLDRHFREGCRVLHFVKAIANADAPTRVATAAVPLPAWPAKPTHARSWRKANQEMGCREPRRRCAGRRVGGSRPQHTLRRAAEHAERA